jgi:hypothetical protein
MSRIGLLVGAASIMNGVSFLMPRAADGVDVNRDENLDFGLKACVVGVGQAGLAITSQLQFDQPAHRLPVMHLDRDHALVSRVLASSHLVFMAGSIKDPALDALRTLAADLGVSLLVLFEDMPEISGIAHSLSPSDRECVVPLNRRTEFGMASTVISEIYGALALPGLVCMDFADVHDVLSGIICRTYTLVAADIKTGIRVFRERLDITRTLSKVDGGLVILSTDHNRQEPLESYLEFEEELHRHVRPDANIFWCANVLGAMPEGFRMTVIAGQRPNSGI